MHERRNIHVNISRMTYWTDIYGETLVDCVVYRTKHDPPTSTDSLSTSLSTVDQLFIHSPISESFGHGGVHRMPGFLSSPQNLASVAPPHHPLGLRGETHSLAGEGVGVPIRTKGQTLWNFMYRNRSTVLVKLLETETHRPLAFSI